MPPPRPLRLAPEWDERFTRSVGLSAVAHLLAVAAILVLAPLAARRPMPLTAYTVELTDPNALGGRLPPGAPGRTLAGGPVPIPAAKGEPEGGAAPEPPPPAEAKAEPAPEPKPDPKPEPAPRTDEPAVILPEKKVEKPKPKVEPKPPPKAEAKPEAKPVSKPEPPKAVAKAEPKPDAKVEPKPAARADAAKSATAAPPKPVTSTGRTAGAAGAGTDDAYAKMAERWFKTQDGGGLGGTERGGSGPIGSGGEGPGGGGQVVGLDFLAYQQRVITTVKSQWVNVVQRPGLVATVRFNIAPDGAVSGAQLVRSSGNAGYDQSVLRAVEVSSPLPRPPARYVTEFSEFEINFESQEKGGQGVG